MPLLRRTGSTIAPSLASEVRTRQNSIPAAALVRTAESMPEGTVRTNSKVLTDLLARVQAAADGFASLTRGAQATTLTARQSERGSSKDPPASKGPPAELLLCQAHWALPVLPSLNAGVGGEWLANQ
jgi:hypothetical protein